MRRLIIVMSVLLLLYVFYPFGGESYSNENSDEFNYESNLKIPEPLYEDPAYVRVMKITGWSEEIAMYFVTEATWRNVNVFKEALPVASVETGNTYRFDLVHYNNNGTSDVGAFQINSVLYPYVVKRLKEEGYEFDSWNRKNPRFNIAAGLFWLSYLKNTYKMEEDRLFTSYNRGIAGGRSYANRNNTYKSDYSEKISLAKENLLKY